MPSVLPHLLLFGKKGLSTTPLILPFSPFTSTHLVYIYVKKPPLKSRSPPNPAPTPSRVQFQTVLLPNRQNSAEPPNFRYEVVVTRERLGRFSVSKSPVVSLPLRAFLSYPSLSPYHTIPYHRPKPLESPPLPVLKYFRGCDG